MPTSETEAILDAVLKSWDRHNQVLLALLRLIPPGGLADRATPDSPRVAEMLTHMHHERMVSVQEEAPEADPAIPAMEWTFEEDADRLAAMLQDSAAAVRRAVETRVRAGRELDHSFGHPFGLIHFLIFHEGYHHGQIKLALKVNGRAIGDEIAGPAIWRLWRERV